MEDAKAIAETEILHMAADMHMQRGKRKKSGVAVAQSDCRAERRAKENV